MYEIEGRWSRFSAAAKLAKVASRVICGLRQHGLATKQKMDDGETTLLSPDLRYPVAQKTFEALALALIPIRDSVFR